jgi:hypothetical protein
MKLPAARWLVYKEHGKSDRGETCAAGIYHVELRSRGVSESTKLILLR